MQKPTATATVASATVSSKPANTTTAAADAAQLPFLTKITSAPPPQPRPATSAGESSSSGFHRRTLSQPLSQPPSQPLPPPPPLPTAVDRQPQQQQQQQRPNVLTKERRPSLSRRPSFTRRRGLSSAGSGSAGTGLSLGLFQSQPASQPSPPRPPRPPRSPPPTALQQLHQRHKSTNSAAGPGGGGSTSSSNEQAVKKDGPTPNYLGSIVGTAITTPSTAAAAVPSILLTGITTTTISAKPATKAPTPAAAPSAAYPTSTKMLNTTIMGPLSSNLGTMSGVASGPNGGTVSPAPEMSLHQHIHDLVSKRVSTLDYLRKAHEGRVYWFNTLRFDRTDMARMPYFDPRRLARRATNYLLLGLSIPAVVDLNSSSAIELLRSLGALLAEFEAFQQIHSETGSGSAASSLSRAARLPNMFRRAPGAKARRASNAVAMNGSSDVGMPGGSFDGTGGMGGGNGGSFSGAPPGTSGSMGVDNSVGGSSLTLVNSESAGSITSGGLGASGGPSIMGSPATGANGSGGVAASTAFATYYDNNTDLLPGEEYAFLLTPSLPFDPDFFETFATLCDVLIDCYQRILGLMPSPRDCTPLVVELFGKADARVRKILVQAAVKEFEDHSRAGVKTEVANIGKVVLGGLM